MPIPTIDLAVAMRDLSVFEKQREMAGGIFKRPISPFAGDSKTFLDQLGRALDAAMIIVYAQGMAVLAAASDKYACQLDLAAVARVWRGGCIIRAALLEDIRMAYCNQPGMPNLLLAPELSKKVMANEQDLRRVACAAIEMGLPAPCFMTALAYFDGYRSAWLPANLIQDQRDYFGAHSYERTDCKGTFHTDWAKG